MIDCRSQALCPNDVVESTYALPEKTKRGPPTNKNISVRNMKAQITNMSLNENNGFKSEYHVRIYSFVILIYCHFFNLFKMDFIGSKIYM